MKGNCTLTPPNRPGRPYIPKTNFERLEFREATHRPRLYTPCFAVSSCLITMTCGQPSLDPSHLPPIIPYVSTRERVIRRLVRDHYLRAITSCSSYRRASSYVSGEMALPRRTGS